LIAGVITASIGRKYLRDAIKSVQEQTYPNIIHYIVCDGIESFEGANSIINEIKFDVVHPIKRIMLDDNTGANNWDCHRIYAASPFLMNTDTVSFLDEDNWFYPNHIESMMTLLRDGGHDWVYSLRDIYNEDGSFLAPDICASLGKYPSWHDTYFVDANCYLVKRDNLIHTSVGMMRKLTGDRQFYDKHSLEYADYECTGLHTVAYRDTNPNKYEYKTRDYIIDGNRRQREKYTGSLPWEQ
jgi:glycosyltransferase involved in cell wall biosynthesis